MGIRHKVIVAGTNNGNSQLSKNAWNDDHEITGEIVLPEVVAPDPATPVVNTLAVFAKKIAGRMMLAQKGPSGLDTSMQPHFGANKIALWMPPGSSVSAPGVFGLNTFSGLGTATTRSIATTNMFTRMSRLGYVSAATPASFAALRETIGRVTVGAGGGLGGFFLRQRFGSSDAALVSGARMFVGLTLPGAPTNVEPDTMVNSIGVAQLSGSGNLQLICSGVNPQPAQDLGALFPAGSLSVDAYELALFAPPNDGVVHWQVTRLNTGDMAMGTVTDNLPNPLTLLALSSWRCNNLQSLAVGLDLCGIYLETDY